MIKLGLNKMKKFNILDRADKKVKAKAKRELRKLVKN